MNHVTCRMNRGYRIVGVMLTLCLLVVGVMGCQQSTPGSKRGASPSPVVYPIDHAAPHLIGTIMSRDQQQYLYAKKGETGFLLYGPYVALPEGDYTVTFRLRGEHLSTREIAIVDVNAFDPPTKTSRALSSIVIRGTDLTAPDQFRDFTLHFSTRGLAGETLYEFRVHSSGASGLWVDQRILKPTG